ncbi:MAG: DUF1080 domain-containing protein [Phycisphaerales bacterium]|nr:DUF1080 domain-containing protein [Phycisphaerales bacterium]
MSIILSCIAMVVGAPLEGAVMRTWNLAEPISSIRPLLPGQAPNAWVHLESLEDVMLPGRDHNVLALIDGAFHVAEEGEYCFELSSDDGSQLWITGTQVVNNDGLHSAQARIGCKTLHPGDHQFQIKYFQGGGDALLSLRWRPPGADAFQTIPADVLRGEWPATRPVDGADKQVTASPARRRAGDTRPLEDMWPGWSAQPVVLTLADAPPVGAVTAIAATGEDEVAAAWDDGSIWIINVRSGRGHRFAADLPLARALEVADGGLMMTHDDGVLLLRDTTGDNVANDERTVETLVPPGGDMVIRDGALRNRQGTIIARLDPQSGINRVVLSDPSSASAVLGTPDELVMARLEEVQNRLRASWYRISGGPSARTGVVLEDGSMVMALDDGSLTKLRTVPTEAFAVENALPMANGVQVLLNHAAARDVLSNTDHWQVEWIDAAGARSPLPIKSASPLLDGRGAFLETDAIHPPGTLHVRLQGPWTSLHGGSDPIWSPQIWAAVHAPSPARIGTVLPRVAYRDNDLSPREELDGWSVLFDGEDPAQHWRGFRQETLPQHWSAQDGALVFSGAGGGDIITREQFDDFDLRLEWTVEPKGNSGIFFNVAEDAPATWATGPEMQILDNARHGDGRNALTSAGSNYALDPPPFDCSLAPGCWNRVRIRVRGDHVEYWLNGIKTADYHLNSPTWKAKVADSKFAGMPRYGQETSGHIALQDHGDRVAFRNIRIKRLDGDD